MKQKSALKNKKKQGKKCTQKEILGKGHLIKTIGIIIIIITTQIEKIRRKENE